MPLLLQISASLSLTIASCVNFAILLLALEGFSLLLYVVTTIDRSHGGVVAAVKYFTFGTLGSIFLLWGVVHLYTLAPSLAYNTTRLLYDYNNLITNEMSNSLEFCSTVILIGLLIKLGAAPLHQWVPDVYSGAPLLITALFATIVKLLIFSVFLRVGYIMNNGLVVDLFAICSLLVGSFITLQQVEIKRFLAYSSITHVGFLLIGDLSASFIYLLTYLCSTLLFFSVLLTVKNYNHELVYLTDLRVLKKKSH